MYDILKIPVFSLIMLADEVLYFLKKHASLVYEHFFLGDAAG